jgi:hypothetical protein
VGKTVGAGERVADGARLVLGDEVTKRRIREVPSQCPDAVGGWKEGRKIARRVRNAEVLDERLAERTGAEIREQRRVADGGLAEGDGHAPRVSPRVAGAQ